MNDAILTPATRDIAVDEVFPHAPETLWTALTTGALIARWIHMTPDGFAPIPGTNFTLKTTPAGAWDGFIRCQVLEAIPCERLVYTWKSGHEGNVGYGAPLDTVVTWTLTRSGAGTRLRVVHAGFVLPRNETAFRNMSDGWTKVIRGIDAIAAEQTAGTRH